MKHIYIYKDRVSRDSNESTIETIKVSRLSDDNYFTSRFSYNPTGQIILDWDTRSNSVCINYIIKF